MKSSFYNKSGQLSAYGFACGYVEKEESTYKKKEMYKEHNCYHVKVFYYVNETSSLDLWETFDSNELTKARKLYNSIKI